MNRERQKDTNFLEIIVKLKIGRVDFCKDKHNVYGGYETRLPNEVAEFGTSPKSQFNYET